MASQSTITALEASLAALNAPRPGYVSTRPATRPATRAEAAAAQEALTAMKANARKVVCQLRNERGQFIGQTTVHMFGGLPITANDVEAELANVALLLAAE